MENIVYDDVHTSATDIPMDNIVSCGNICYDNVPAIESELAINNSISKDAICCDQVPKPVSVGVNIHRPEVIRDGRRDCKTILIIIFIAVILSAGTVYTLLQLLRLKSEIGYASTASMELGDSSNSDSMLLPLNLNWQLIIVSPKVLFAVIKFQVGANIKHSGVIRYGRRNCKAILIIIFIAVIILILSATCAGTVYTL